MMHGGPNRIDPAICHPAFFCLARSQPVATYGIWLMAYGYYGPNLPASAYVNCISCLQTLRFVAKTSGHLFVRKNYNAPHPPGKSWSTIDRALQNGSQLLGEKHIVKTKTVSSKKGREFFFRVSRWQAPVD